MEGSLGYQLPLTNGYRQTPLSQTLTLRAPAVPASPTHTDQHLQQMPPYTNQSTGSVLETNRNYKVKKKKKEEILPDNSVL